MTRGGNELYAKLSTSAALLLSAGAVAYGIYEKVSDDSVNSAPAPACISPSPHEIHTVERLLQTPETVVSYQITGQTEQAYQAHRQVLGRKYHLTFPNTSLETMLEYGRHKPTFNYVFRNSQKFLKEFGVSLSIARAGVLGLKDNQIPNSKDLNNNTTSYNILNLIRGFEELPKEYFAYSGLKRIVLAKNIGDYAAYATTDGSHNSVVVNIDGYESDTALSDHEVYHLVDAAECGSTGSMFNDPSYGKINPTNIYTRPIPGNRVTEQGRLDAALGRLDNDEANKKIPRKIDCKAQATLQADEAKTVAFTNYALTNVVEDKAEIGKNFAYPESYGELLNPHTPIIKQKFEFLLARLYHFRPNIVRYLAAAGRRYFGETIWYNPIKDCHQHNPH